MLRGVISIFLPLGFAYYFQVRFNVKVSRAIHMLLGVSPIGIAITMALLISELGHSMIASLGRWPAFIIAFPPSFTIGAS